MTDCCDMPIHLDCVKREEFFFQKWKIINATRVLQLSNGISPSNLKLGNRSSEIKAVFKINKTIKYNTNVRKVKKGKR